MARFPTFIVAALVAATTLTAPVAAQQADDGQRPAPKPSTPSTPQAQPRRPPAQQPAQKPPTPPPSQERKSPTRPAPRPPSTQQTPPRAVPRPPAVERPRVMPGERTWIYPIYPPLTFDLIYGFPYGLYPYWTYGDPYGDPYGLYYSAPLPVLPARGGRSGRARHRAIRRAAEGCDGLRRQLLCRRSGRLQRRGDGARPGGGAASHRDSRAGIRDAHVLREPQGRSDDHVSGGAAAGSSIRQGGGA